MRERGSVNPTFLKAHTTASRTPLVPEITLHVAADVVALWEAIEAHGGTAGLDPPFWAAAWPGGQALARYLLDRPEVVARRSVLDIGSGSGLVAIAAALAGAGEVAASDIDPYAFAAIAFNAAANEVTGIRIVGDVLAPLPEHAGRPADVVLAGDVCYDRAMSAQVLPFLRAAAARGSLVLLGDPGRAYLPTDGMHALAGYDVPDVAGPIADGAVRRVTVWRLH